MRFFIPKSCKEQATKAFLRHKWAKRQLGQSKSKQEIARELQMKRKVIGMMADEIEKGGEV